MFTSTATDSHNFTTYTTAPFKPLGSLDRVLVRIAAAVAVADVLVVSVEGLR